MLRTHKYCEICRDEGDLDIRCNACGGGFHAFCYAQTYDPSRLKLAPEAFTCEPCHARHGDMFCTACKATFDLANEPRENIQKCPGCSKQVHLSCAERFGLMVDTSRGQLVSECGAAPVSAEHLMWVCTQCTARIKMKIRRETTIQHGRIVKKDAAKDAANNAAFQLHQAFCEVCQKGGKLLLCDTCPKSYHATCIEHIASLDAVGTGSEWKCPVCLGVDLYNNPDAVRLSERELEERLAMRNQHNGRRIRWVTKRRNQWLSTLMSQIQPFIGKNVASTLHRDRNFADKHFRMGDVVRVTPPRDEIGAAFIFNQDAVAVLGGEGGDKEQEEGTVGGTAVTEPFIGTVLEEASMNEENMLTVVNHENPKSIIKVKEKCGVYLCSASQQRTRYPCNPKDASVFLARTKNGMDFLAEGVQLKDYQVRGVDWVTRSYCDRGGCILADDMGLGKTLQALAFLANLHHSGGAGPHLIIVPYAVVGNWLRECRRFTPQLRVAKISGDKREQEWTLDNLEVRYGERDLYITTYETLVSNEAFFAGMVWQTVTLDEAHRIKNQIGRVRMALGHIETSFRLLLTGTPLQNNIQELFVLLNYLWPDVLQDSKTFEEAISFENAANIAAKKEKLDALRQKELEAGLANPESSIGQEEEDLALDNAGFTTNKQLLDKVRGLLEKLMLRRTKGEVLRLPPKQIHNVWLPINPIGVFWARLIYRCHDELIDRRKNQQGLRMLMSLLLKIRLICCHPRALMRSKTSGGMFDEFASAAMWGNPQKALEDLSGEAHALSSNKVIFLDKVLTQCYCENVAKIPSWKATHEKNKTSRPTSCEADDVSTCVENLDLYLDVMRTWVHGSATPGTGPMTTSAGAGPSAESSTTTQPLDVVNLQATTGATSAGEQVEGGLDLGSGTGDVEMADVAGAVPPAVAIARTKEHTIIGGASSSSSSSSAAAPSTTVLSSSSSTTFKPHKIILFTQFQMVLDELETYCKFRRWKYLRLDGSTNKVIRELDVKEFNSPDSQHLIFLMSTRAGGVGINLQSANFVVLFDQDWNPHIDTQAMDRSHRIGQDRAVTVYRLLTEWTVEERLAHRCEQKMGLNKALIDDEGGHEASDEKLSLQEILAFLKHGRRVLTEQFEGESLSDKSITQVLTRAHQPLPVADSPESSEEEGSAGGPENLVMSVNEAMMAEGSGPAGFVPGAANGHYGNQVPMMSPSIPESSPIGGDSSAVSSASSSSATAGAASNGNTSRLVLANNNAQTAAMMLNGSTKGVNGKVGVPPGMIPQQFLNKGVHPANGFFPPGAGGVVPQGQGVFPMFPPGTMNSMMGVKGAPGLPPGGAGFLPQYSPPSSFGAQQQMLLAANSKRSKAGALQPLAAQMSQAGVRATTFETRDDGKVVRRSTRQRKPTARFQPPPPTVEEPQRKRTVFSFKYDRDCFVCKQATLDASGEPICKEAKMVPVVVPLEVQQAQAASAAAAARRLGGLGAGTTGTASSSSSSTCFAGGDIHLGQQPQQQLLEDVTPAPHPGMTSCITATSLSNTVTPGMTPGAANGQLLDQDANMSSICTPALDDVSLEGGPFSIPTSSATGETTANSFSQLHQPQAQQLPSSSHEDSQLLGGSFTTGGSTSSSSSAKPKYKKDLSEVTLICSKCPRTYHAKCQGITGTLPKTFICSWHECLCCRRRANDVGGMLVQCVACPKAYCIDCFPQSFRRVYPEDSFFNRLQKQGWEHANRERMVNFECNDCRLLREQEESKALNLEDAKKREKEAMAEERKRLREEKKMTEKTARAQAKAEQEELRLKKKEEEAQRKKNSKGTSGGAFSGKFESIASTSAGPGGSNYTLSNDILKVEWPALTLREMRNHWLDMRQKLRESLPQIVERMFPPAIKKRLQLFRADKNDLTCFDKDAEAEDKYYPSKESAYHGISLDLLKRHLFDMYFEPEGDDFSLVAQHVEHAKGEQENDSEIAKTTNFIQLPSLCFKCSLPGHKQKACPRPTEQVNKLTPGAAKKRYLCPVCDRAHKMVSCPVLNEDQRNDYISFFGKASTFLNSLVDEQGEPRIVQPYLPSYDELHLDQACREICTQIATTVLYPKMLEVGLGEYILAGQDDEAADAGSPEDEGEGDINADEGKEEGKEDQAGSSKDNTVLAANAKGRGGGAKAGAKSTGSSSASSSSATTASKANAKKKAAPKETTRKRGKQAKEAEPILTKRQKLLQEEGKLTAAEVRFRPGGIDPGASQNTQTDSKISGGTTIIKKIKIPQTSATTGASSSTTQQGVPHFVQHVAAGPAAQHPFHQGQLNRQQIISGIPFQHQSSSFFPFGMGVVPQHQQHMMIDPNLVGANLILPNVGAGLQYNPAVVHPQILANPNLQFYNPMQQQGGKNGKG
ncbi:unnamed protein product [Amoebophrya sp. A25]|nr:unnamed protein product [Amoebophrya sp. A25]|eukprot:GSA25T00026266001.1